MAENDNKLPELSEMAWGILDRAAGLVKLIEFDKCAPGPRDALLGYRLVEKTLTQAAGRESFRHKGHPARYGLVITDLGRKLLADHKAARSAGESG